MAGKRRRHRARSWEKLDNTANVFPVIAGEEMSNTYRIAAELKEEISGTLLQEALANTLPHFPGFKQRLRRGVFWYYLEENVKPAPKVRKEHNYPCRYIHESRSNSYLFRVCYFGCRINLEVFHVLADGSGGVGFLKELCYEYLRLSHSDLREKVGDGLSAGTSLDREDSFLRNYRKPSKSVYKSTPAFLIKGEKLPGQSFGIMHGRISVQQIKEVAKRYGISINEYLVADFIYATWKAYRGKIRKNRPIRVAVPVNLRPYFDSMTTKNFFVMVSAEFAPEREDYTFEEIAQLTAESLRSQITKENLEAIFSYNVSNEQVFVAKLVPLPLKNAAIRLVYMKKALANTTTVTNMGRIDVAEEYKPYFAGFHCYLTFSAGQYIKVGLMSFEDILTISISSALVDTSVQKHFFRRIAKDGVDVSIETNGVWYV